MFLLYYTTRSGQRMQSVFNESAVFSNVLLYYETIPQET